MELSPIEFTGRALKTFEDATRGRLGATGPAPSKRETADAHAMLGMLLDNLDSLFPDETRKREARSYIHELRLTRNKWAHSQPLDYEDAYRAADTVCRLLKLLDADRQGAEALRRELRAMTAQEAIYQDQVGSPRPSAGNFSRVTVVACSKLKLNEAAPAIELYTGPIFRSSIDVAKADGLPILILSTRYGLLDPTDVIEPYELSYQAMTPSEREKLVGVLRKQSRPLIDAGLKEFVVLGGGDYRYLLQRALEESDVKVGPHPRWKEVYKQFYR